MGDTLQILWLLVVNGRISKKHKWGWVWIELLGNSCRSRDLMMEVMVPEIRGKGPLAQRGTQVIKIP